MDTRQLLLRNPALRKLDAPALDELARVTSVERLSRGRPLWRAGERATSLVIVAHGLVKVMLPSSGARDQVLGLYGPGEAVGGAAVLDGGAHAADAIALTEPVMIARIPADRVLAALSHNGAAALEFGRAIASLVASANRRIALFTASAEERLASTLIDLGERFGDEMEDGTTLIPLRLTRAELASLIGTTVETTIRTLSRWSREGLVSTVDGGLTVHDRDALVRRSAPSSPFAAPAPAAPAAT